jgi:hypothetical protein
MALQYAPTPQPMLRRRFHHYFANPMPLQSGRQVAGLALHQSEFPLRAQVQSSRSATIGSTTAAREAGKYPAAPATASSNSETQINTAGSVGVVS